MYRCTIKLIEFPKIQVTSIMNSLIFCRRRASPGQYMIFVTFLSVSLNFRKFFEFRLNKDWSDYETTSLMEYPPYIVFSNTWQELVVTGALPFLVLLFCNISIYLKIRESSKHESHRYVLHKCILHTVYLNMVFVLQICG